MKLSSSPLITSALQLSEEDGVCLWLIDILATGMERALRRAPDPSSRNNDKIKKVVYTDYFFSTGFK